MGWFDGPRTVEHAHCVLPWCVWTSYSSIPYFNWLTSLQRRRSFGEQFSDAHNLRSCIFGLKFRLWIALKSHSRGIKLSHDHQWCRVSSRCTLIATDAKNNLMDQFFCLLAIHVAKTTNDNSARPFSTRSISSGSAVGLGVLFSLSSLAMRFSSSLCVSFCCLSSLNS